MNDAYLQLLLHLTAVWRRRWYVIAVSWLVCGAGWTMVASLPDRYESSARIYVDVDTMLGPLMRGLAVEMNLYQQIDLMQRTLLSRPNLEKLILMTDLDYQVDSPEHKESLIRNLQARVSLEQQGRNLFKVGFMDPDPNLAKRVVQAVLQIFVEGNLGASRKDMDTTRRFLQSQIREYEQQLQDSEMRLAKFKRENMGLLPGEGNYHEHMQSVNTQLERTQEMLSEARQVMEVLNKQLRETPEYVEVADTDARNSPFQVGDGGPDSDKQVKIMEMQSAIDDMMLRYTDKHPDVVFAKKRMTEIQNRSERKDMNAPPGPPGEAEGEGAGGAAMPGPGAMASAAAATAVPPSKRMPNPLYEKIKLRMVQQESGIAALSGRIEQKKLELEKWSKQAQTVPQVEAEMTRLSRDYQIIKSGYEQLRSRQESARLAQDLETKAQKVQFRIVDPPDLPLSPSGPNRPLYLSVVLLAGVLAGLAFSFLLSQITGAFETVQALRNSIAAPVIGAISAVMSPRERRRRTRELVSFGVVCLGLVAAFGGLLTVEMLVKA